MQKRHRSYYYHRAKSESSTPNRLISLMVVVSLLFFVILGRLFQLQILDHSNYFETAKAQHFGEITLKARRGEILVQDNYSGEFSKLATNTTLDLVYVDPFIVEDKVKVAKELTPLLFNNTEYETCLEIPEECFYEIIKKPEVTEPILSEDAWIIDSEAKKPTLDDEPEYKTYAEMIDEIAASTLRKISKEEVDFTTLKRGAENNEMAEVINANLPGIFVNEEKLLIYGDPTLIPEDQLTPISTRLSEILEKDQEGLKAQLTRRKVRYVYLKNRISPETSRKIKALKLKGVVLLPEHWRFYPENSLGAHVIGFLNREEVGQYGIEGFFNNDLEGAAGTIYAEKDPLGRQITVGSGEIVDAIDGDTVILTIDRVVQKKVEEVLEDAVKRYRADGGQVMIMDPFTGAIIAMANYPTYDPNVYTKSFKLRKVEAGEKIQRTVPIFVQDEKKRYVPAKEEERENEEIDRFVYENKFGPEVFKNKLVSEFYEPGSVFKPLIMAMALDAKEVEPQTSYLDDGPLKIDEFTIRNAENIYRGQTSMVDVLAYSMNTGMSFIAKKLGPKLMYQYLKDFGFGEYSNVQLEGETKGRVDYYQKWSKAQLLTTSFGQGIVATPLQVLTAWSAMANGGKLMQPRIVDAVIREGEIIKSEPRVIRRVISEETSSIISSMNVHSVREGVAAPADVPGYAIAGKTGTSQIAGKNGKYETGEGSTITSFAGYAPANKPKFVMIVKMDRPRIGDNTWGSTTAAPTFRRITEFLMDYYNIESSI